MATTITWIGMRSASYVIPSGSGLGFYSNRSGGPIAIGSWNAETFTATVSGSYATRLNNTQSGSTSLPIRILDAPLRISVALDSAEHANAVLYAYALGGTGAPTGANVVAAEALHGTEWQAIGGAVGLNMVLQDPATTHDYYVALSVSPTAVGGQIGNRFVFSVTYGGLIPE